MTDAALRVSMIERQGRGRTYCLPTADGKSNIKTHFLYAKLRGREETQLFIVSWGCHGEAGDWVRGCHWGRGVLDYQPDELSEPYSWTYC